MINTQETKQLLEEILAKYQTGESPSPDLVQLTLNKAYWRIQELEEEVRRDGLTQVFNRGCFDKDIERIFYQHDQHDAMALLLVDIDHFKNVNDTYGHQKGDEILHNVAQTLVKYTRKGDLVYRYGGEEFSILLPQTSAEEAQIVMEKLRTKVSEETGVTISIGAANYESGLAGPEYLIKQADQALYMAKAGGRNCGVIYTKEKYFPVKSPKTTIEAA